MTIMLIGLGGLGQATLELLAREHDIDRIVVGSRDEQRGVERCNLVRMGAVAQGYHPRVEFVPLDLDRVNPTADTIHQMAPDVILNTASMMTWWYPDLFPEAQRLELLSAGFGVWLPLHLHLVMKLMQILKLVNYKGYALNASFPDVVNSILKARGLTPTAGAGNLDEMVPKLKLLSAEQLGVGAEELTVTMVGHHALGGWVFGDRAGQPPPFFVKVEHQGQDVTETVNPQRMLFSTFPMVHGPEWNRLSAGSMVRMICALLSEKDTYVHAPGPHGLPGGYPVTVSRRGLEVTLPPELSLEQAIHINRSSHQYDGIQGIDPDGSVIFCQESVEIMRQELGYECERLLPWETESRAKELIDRFHSYAANQGVDLPGLA